MEVMDVVCTYSRIAFSGECPGRVLSVECVSRHASKVRRVVSGSRAPNPDLDRARSPETRAPTRARVRRPEPPEAAERTLSRYISLKFVRLSICK